MTEITIVGKLLDKPEDRDAIHVAVACVIADEQLRPGQHIGFRKGADDTETVVGWLQGGKHAIGIVDPFLPHQVEKGERFWMFLYQHTITSLKHNWTHPSFGPEVKAAKSADAVASEAWLRDFISNADCPEYEVMLQAATYGQAMGKDEYGDNFSVTINEDNVYVGGIDACASIPSEFWDHMEIVTGKKMTNRPDHFRCSC